MLVGFGLMIGVGCFNSSILAENTVFGSFLACS